MRKVLIAVDYDPSAKVVAEKGYFMHKSTKAKITLLHVISQPVFYYATYSIMSSLLNNDDQTYAASQDFLDEIKRDLGDKTIRTLVKMGDTSDCILKTAKEMNADIIVIGTHSRKWLEDIIMGSVAESIIKQSTLPLLIIPTKKHELI